MGRPVKRGLDYFPLDVDFFTNKKIKALRRAHGLIGVLTYLNLLCRIYQNGYYFKFDDLNELSMDIAEEIGNEQIKRVATCVTETINYLVKQGILAEGLFEKDIISGTAMQEQYGECLRAMKRKADFEEYLLIPLGDCTPKNEVSTEETGVYSEETAVNTEESTQRERETESKNIHSFNLSRESEDNEEFSTSQRKRLGKIGKGVVMLSDEQIGQLLSEMSLDEFDYYCGVVADCELSGKSFKKKTHFQAIRDMARKDRGV